MGMHTRLNELSCLNIITKLNYVIFTLFRMEELQQPFDFVDILPVFPAD